MSGSGYGSLSLAVFLAAISPVRAAADSIRHLRGVEDGVTDRMSVFYLLLLVAVAAVIGSLVCICRDCLRHQQYKLFQGRSEANDLSINEGNSEQDSGLVYVGISKSRGSAITGHVERVLDSIVSADVSPRMRFARHLDSMQGISIVYSALRCVAPLMQSLHKWTFLREHSMPLTAVWLIWLTRLTNLFLSEAVLTYLFLSNPGICSYQQSELGCRRPLQLDGYKSMCVWSSATRECLFEPTAPGGSDDTNNRQLYYYLVLAILSTLLSAPLNTVCEWVIGKYVSEMRLHTAVASTPSQFTKQRRLVECVSETSNPQKRSPNSSANGGRAVFFAPPETVLRAVRLQNLQQRIDRVDLAEEKYSFVSSISPFGTHRARLLRLLRVPIDSDSPILIDGAVEADLARARAVCEYSITEVLPLIGQYASDLYLTRLFLYEAVAIGASMTAKPFRPIWNGVCAVAARRYLFGESSSLVQSPRSPLVDPQGVLLPHLKRASAYLSLLLGYVVGVCILLYRFGVHMSKLQSDAWVDRFIVCYLIVFLVLEPLRAFVHDISMLIVVQHSLSPIVENMISRTEFVLGRLSGQLDLDRCGVQHVFAACRIARIFPSLPISRLLISLRDSDIVGATTEVANGGCTATAGLANVISSMLIMSQSAIFSSGTQVTLGAGYVLSLQFGSVAGGICVFVALILWYFFTELHFFISLFLFMSQALRNFVTLDVGIKVKSIERTYQTVLNQSREIGPDGIRSLSSDSCDPRETVELRNMDSMEIGFFSDKQETIRSEQKSRSDLLLLPQNSFLRNPSISTFGNNGYSHKSIHNRGVSMDSAVSLQSDISGQSGPIMLIKNNVYSSSDDESSDDDASGSRGIDDLLQGLKKMPARGPKKRSGRTPPSTSPNGSLKSVQSGSQNDSPPKSSKKSPKKGHYSPALTRLSSLRRTSQSGSVTELGVTQDSSPSDVMPDISAVGDIKRNRWLRLKRTWATARVSSDGKSSSNSYPIPYTMLEAINKADAATIDGKCYIFGHKTPKRDSNRVARVLQGKVISVTSCSFDETGSLWVHHLEDEAWFFAFDMEGSKRGAVPCHFLLPCMVTVLYTELRAPYNKEERAYYETLFTFQLLFLKGTALELRRSFGALADLNRTLENSLKVLELRDANSSKMTTRAYKFFSALPVDMEGKLDLYEENESRLSKFVCKVELWLLELLHFVESDQYDDSNIPVVITNFLAPNNTDVELMTNKIMQIVPVATPPPSPSYVKKRPSGMPMFEADLFEY